MFDASSTALGTGRLPRALCFTWLAATPGATWFSLRMLYEKTWLTWSQGGQSVGFWLWHAHPGAGVWGWASSVLMGACSLCAAGWLVWRGARGRPAHPIVAWAIAASVLLLALHAVPPATLP